jgi:5'-deoxynucleotidase YfbR-like HD superfamily hydrolase
MIVMTILPPTYDCRNLLRASLTHDLHELVSGDSPATAKWQSVKLAEALEDMEQQFNGLYDINHNLSEYEVRVLKWADVFELVLYCAHQEYLGNRYATTIKNRGLDYLRELGFPTKKAQELYYESFG